MIFFIFGIKVARTSQKIFGIYFDNKGINIKTLIDLKLKIIQLTQELKNRSRTLRGRASIFNVLIALKLWYIASVHVIPPLFIKKITRIMFQFIWNSNFERISRDTMYLKKLDGGLRVINLELKCMCLLLKHVGTLLKAEGELWENLAMYWLKLKLVSFKLIPMTLNTPSAWEMSSFYKKCWDGVVLLSQTPNLDINRKIIEGMTVKIIYNVIHRKNHVVTISKNARAINFDIVWENIYGVKLYDSDFNVNYMILHGVLPVKEYSIRKHIIQDNTCLWCGQTKN